MDDELFITPIYLCPRCLTPASEPGPCLNDGTERLTCKPGDPDDPCRKPLIDGAGQLRSQAPLWWLRFSVAALAEAQRKELHGVAEDPHAN